MRKVKLSLGAGVLAAALVIGAVVVAPCASCTPAEVAVRTQIETKVLALLESKSTLPEIEAAIADLMPGAPADAIDLAITAAIDILHATNAIPPTVLPTALSLQEKVATKRAARAPAPAP